ncbi:MAG: glycosyltransferase [Acidobacteria bacterium]|nr:glycosyltransferase [Acidobacteriota bacterium]
MDAKLPLVTIITPCLNMESFIRKTIESVLSQDYPNIEYILVDGGSTDRTAEVICEFVAQYPDRMRLIVEPDGGVAEALEKGLAAAKGKVFAYINADDTYFPGAVRTAVHWLQENPDNAGVYGNAYWIDNDGKRIDSYPTEPFHKETLVKSCYICQPACFLRADVLRSVGGFDTEYQVAFDYELWLRLAQTHELLKIEALLANSRMHRSNKTLRQRTVGFEEACRALRKYYGYVPFRWAHSYASFLLDQRDQFFEPLRPSFTKFVFSLIVGTLLNWSSPFRFWKEWSGVMSLGAFVRRWNDTWVARRMGMLIR